MVTDGKKTARAVSFETSLREAFTKSKDQKKPLQLLNCSIKPNKELEILANNHSRVVNSPKTDTTAMDSKNIQLSDLHDLATGQIVNVCKVVALSPPQKVETKAGKQLILQNLTIGDAKSI